MQRGKMERLPVGTLQTTRPTTRAADATQVDELGGAMVPAAGAAVRWVTYICASGPPIDVLLGEGGGGAPHPEVPPHCAPHASRVGAPVQCVRMVVVMPAQS